MSTTPQTRDEDLRAMVDEGRHDPREITAPGDDHHRWLCTCCGDVVEGAPIARSTP